MVIQPRITSFQLTLLLFVSIISSAIIRAASISITYGGRDSWVGLLVINTLIGLIISWICVYLCKSFPQQNFFEFMPKIVGKILGTILNISFIFFFYWHAEGSLWEFAYFIKNAFLNKTPFIVFCIAIMLISIYLAYNGLEVICRLNVVLIPGILISLVVIFFGVSNKMEYSNFLPFFEKGLLTLYSSTIPSSTAWITTVMMVVVIAPYVHEKEKLFKSCISAVIFSNLVLTLQAIVILGVFGDKLVKHLNFPYYWLTRYAMFTTYLERIETLIVFIWVALISIQIAFLLYCINLGMIQVFKLKDKNLMILPISISLIVSTLIFIKPMNEIIISLTMWVGNSTIFHIIIPILLFIITFIRNKRRRLS